MYIYHFLKEKQPTDKLMEHVSKLETHQSLYMLFLTIEFWQRDTDNTQIQHILFNTWAKAFKILDINKTMKFFPSFW